MAAPRCAAALVGTLALLATGANAYSCNATANAGEICPADIDWIYEPDAATFTSEFAPTHLEITLGAFTPGASTLAELEALLLTVKVSVCATNGTFSDGTECVSIVSRAVDGDELKLGVALPPEFSIGISNTAPTFYDVFMDRVPGNLAAITAGPTVTNYRVVEDRGYVPRAKYGETSADLYLFFDTPVRRNNFNDLFATGDLVFTGTSATTAIATGATAIAVPLDPVTIIGGDDGHHYYLVEINISGASPTYTLSGGSRWDFTTNGGEETLADLPWPASSPELDIGTHILTSVVYATAMGGADGATPGYDRCIFVFMDEMNATLLDGAFIGTGGGIFNVDASATTLFTSVRFGTAQNIIVAEVSTPVLTFGSVACRVPNLQSLRGKYGYYEEAAGSLTSFATTETLIRPGVGSATYYGAHSLLTITITMTGLDTDADLGGLSDVSIASHNGSVHTLTDGSFNAGGRSVTFRVSPALPVVGTNAPATLVFAGQQNGDDGLPPLRSADGLPIVGFNGTAITNSEGDAALEPVSALALDPGCAGGATRVAVTYNNSVFAIGSGSTGTWTVSDGSTTRDVSGSDVTVDGSDTVLLDFTPNYGPGANLTVTFASAVDGTVVAHNGEYPGAGPTAAVDGTGPVLLSASAVPGSSVVAAVFDRNVNVASGADVRFAGDAIFGVAITETNGSVVHFATTSPVRIDNIVEGSRVTVDPGGVRSGADAYCGVVQNVELTGDPDLLAEGPPSLASAATRDANGDGRVDSIFVNFTGSVLLPSGGALGLSVNSPGTSFTVDSAVFSGGTTAVLLVTTPAPGATGGDTGPVQATLQQLGSAIVSLAGVPLLNGSATNITDGARPAVVDAVAVVGTRAVHVTLSENTTGATTSSIEWSGAAAATVVEASYSADDPATVVLVLDRDVLETDRTAPVSVEVTDSNGITDAAGNTAVPGQFEVTFEDPAEVPLDFTCARVNGTTLVLTTSIEMESGFSPHAGAYDVTSPSNGDAVAAQANVTGAAEITLQIDPSLLSTTETGGRYSVSVGATTAFQAVGGTLLAEYPTTRTCPDGTPPTVSSVTPLNYTNSNVRVLFTENVITADVVFAFTTSTGTTRNPVLVTWIPDANLSREVLFEFAPGELPASAGAGIVVRVTNLTDAAGNTADGGATAEIGFSHPGTSGGIDTRDGVASDNTQLFLAFAAICLFLARGAIYAVSAVPRVPGTKAAKDEPEYRDPTSGAARDHAPETKRVATLNRGARVARSVVTAAGYSIIAVLVYDRGDRKQDNAAIITLVSSMAVGAAVLATLGEITAEMIACSLKVVLTIVIHPSRFSSDAAFTAVGITSVVLVAALHAPCVHDRRALIAALSIGPISSAVAFAFL